MDNSPFSKLSPEIANIIAELALYDEDGISISDRKHRHALALAQTCKYMRTTYTEVFYNINTFSLRAASFSEIRDCVATFTKSIGPKCIEATGPIGAVMSRPYSGRSATHGEREEFYQLLGDMNTSHQLTSIHTKVLLRDGSLLEELRIDRPRYVPIGLLIFEAFLLFSAIGADLADATLQTALTISVRSAEDESLEECVKHCSKWCVEHMSKFLDH